MSLFISSINSGSNGNCYYVGNANDAVLVDAGISCREIEKRMLRSNLNIKKVRAIFISHEHSDHIRGLDVLARKYDLPVYISERTHLNCGFRLEQTRTFDLKCSSPVDIGSLKITPFSKRHDAADPFSFTITFEGVRVGVFTDIGAVCDKLIKHFSNCHAAFLESNYDDDMLAKSPYPFFLKRRISGGNGHLSNAQALALFLEHRSPDLQQLLLSHLSKNNNCPELVGDLFRLHAGQVNVHIASRYEESAVFQVFNHMVSVPVPRQVALFGSY